MTQANRRKSNEGVPGTDLVRQAGGIAPFLRSFQTNLDNIAPKHVNIESFMGLAISYVNRDEKLTAAAMRNPQSLVLTLRECAALGHVPMRGTYALVPFKNDKAVGGIEVVGIEEYTGVIERMFRAGGVVSVHVEVVRANDSFELRRGQLPDHHYDPFQDDATRGPLVGVYAWAVMQTGHLSHVVWLNKAQVMKHRAVSRSGDRFWGPMTGPESPWAQDMWKKTGLHVLEKFVPTSAAYRWEVAGAAAASDLPRVGGAPVPLTPAQGADPDPTIHDAEIVDDTPPEPDPWPETAQPGSGATT